MFPFELEEDEELVDEDELEEEEDIEEPPMEYGIDFTTGQLTGGKVSGVEACLVWAWNALHYPRYEYELSTWNYGHELAQILYQSIPTVKATALAEVIVRECLSPNPYIEDITDFSFEKEDDVAHISFSIITPFGEGELENVTV